MNKIDYIQSAVNGKPIKRNGKAHKTLIAKGLMTLEAEPPVVAPVVAPAVEKDEVKSLVQNTTKTALAVFKKIKSGEVEIPDNLDDDAKLSQYLSEMMYLEMLKGSPKKPKKSKKKLYVSSDDESESD